MAYQQKLFHVHYVNGAAAANAVAINTNFRLVNLANPLSTQVAPDTICAEVIGGDPGANFRDWITNRTTAGFTYNWAGLNLGLDLRIAAGKRHSICFDISITQSPY